MATDNPFHFGTPVPLDDPAFTGRREEIGVLTALMRDHLSAVLLSPRRFGKTSILLRAAHVVEKDRPAVVRTNAYATPSAARFAASLASGIYELSGARARGRGAVDFLRRLRLRPLLGIADDGHPEIRFEGAIAARDLVTVLEDTFDILEELAAKQPAVLVIDEFQAIVDIDPDLPSVLKGLLDARPNVSLIAAGSKKHLMEQLFVDRGAPLFNMVEKITIGPLPTEEMVEFICRRAAASGTSCEVAAARHVVELAGPVPDDIQHLAWAAFEDARQGHTLDVDNVESGKDLIIGRHAHLFEDLFAKLPRGQRSVITQLAIAPTAHPNSGEFVARSRLANNTSVRQALRVLVEDQLVEDRSGTYVVADPFWASWLRERSAK